MHVKRKVFLALLLLISLVVRPATLFAQTSTSTSYQVNEATFASGGDVNANSSSYNARGSVGNLGVGEAGSTSYNAVAGSVTPSEEFLELNVPASTIDLGTLTTATTGVGVGSFYIRTYVNSGYVIKTMSNPLTNGAKVLTAMSGGGASTVGTEQFGINLVANTAPTTTGYPSGGGANPALQPNNGFSNFATGVAASGYATPNSYKYNVGDTIAQSGSGGLNWGQTNFTITYIANVSPTTPGGAYTMPHDIVAIPTY
jgi:hypothetical protein